MAQAPVLFRGIGLTVSADSELVRGLGPGNKAVSVPECWPLMARARYLVPERALLSA